MNGDANFLVSLAVMSGLSWVRKFFDSFYLTSLRLVLNTYQTNTSNRFYHLNTYSKCLSRTVCSPIFLSADWLCFEILVAPFKDVDGALPLRWRR